MISGFVAFLYECSVSFNLLESLLIMLYTSSGGFGLGLDWTQSTFQLPDFRLKINVIVDFMLLQKIVGQEKKDKAFWHNYQITGKSLLDHLGISRQCGVFLLLVFFILCALSSNAPELLSPIKKCSHFVIHKFN